MYYTKFPHPANFSYAQNFDPRSGMFEAGGKRFHFTAESHEGGIHHLSATRLETWRPNRPLAPLTPPPVCRSHGLEIGAHLETRVIGPDGNPWVTAPRTGSFGVCGEASLFQFEMPSDARYYGMGEKWFGRLELSGVRTKFYNTDVWSDFHWSQWMEHPVDPPYFTTPYVAVKVPQGWIGFLIDNPAVTFMSTPGREGDRAFAAWQATHHTLLLGSESGEPHLWILTAESLAELTRKLQSLVGRTPLPPLWSLGFHQSRWGYGGHKDLTDLDQKFAKHEIPCSGLWLDLDYMDGFRIFQTNVDQFPNGVQSTADALAKNGRRIVPIIDPGVKQEPGYRVYDDGRKHKVFCKNPEGGEFVGIVWPGDTVFPDFIQHQVRDWWAGYAAEFRDCGFGAAWVDMNDPSTGPVDPQDMLFEDGQAAHNLHRNQYALGMQMATVEGFLRARPNERPFLLTRSGFTGTSRFSAVWTGDNVSNEFHLRISVPTTLGMSISGIPFNGPDVAGFGGDAHGELMTRWIQACFLFPFFRNHSTLESRREEPWQYPRKFRETVAHYIRLRYRFLPYLYQLFITQEESGDPIVRPVLYDFEDPEWYECNDQFMVGPELMHAPLLTVKKKEREVALPRGQGWFDLSTGRRLGASEKRAVNLNESPLLMKPGAIVPVQREVRGNSEVDLLQPVFLVNPGPDNSVSETEFVADDGLTFDYRSGARSRMGVRLIWGETVEIFTRQDSEAVGRIRPSFLLTREPKSVTLDGEPCKASAVTDTFTGSPIKLWLIE